MTRAVLAKLLRKLADQVESGDSAEGRLAYIISEREGHEIDVDICVRQDNLNGQGGMFVLNEHDQQESKDE